MSGLVLWSCDGGTVVLPHRGTLLIDRADGGHLCVNPPRAVWERSELTADELARWSLLIAAVGRAMIDALPQLKGGCVNYWEAGNWALNEAALPPGVKNARTHRNVHQHLIGRSPEAMSPSWKWGEAPIFPLYADRLSWSREFQPLTGEECAAVLDEARRRMKSGYALNVPEDPKPRLVVFDMAGTTIEDGGQVPRAFVRSLAQHGIELDESQITGLRGASKREAIRRFIPDGPDREMRSVAAYETFRKTLALSYSSEGVRAIAGAAAIFQWLRTRGVKVALNTGFDRDITHLLLDTLGWREGLVDYVACGDDVTRGRPAPDLIKLVMRGTGIDDPTTVANVGDTTLDLEAGHAAGVAWNVGVLSGAHDEARLLASPHTHIAPDVSYLRALFGP